MVVLKDIAAALGVSISVVSRVLNNRMGNTRVRPVVAEQIRAKAREMGYQPNPAAVALSSGRQNVLGVFIHRIGTLGSGIIEKTIEGISAASRAARLRLMTTFFSSAEEFIELSSVISRRSMDGLLIVGKPHRELLPRLLALRESGLPVATLYHESLHEGIPNAGLNQGKVGQLATAHLLARGCRRVAHVRGMPQRLAGYQQALAEAGVSYDPSLVFADSYRLEPEAGAAIVQHLLAGRVPFDGLVAQSDAQAVRAVNELFSCGIRVPDQVRVVGADDSPHCELCRVPLTSVSQLYGQRAERAVELLRASIAGQPVESVELEPVLCERESSR